ALEALHEESLDVSLLKARGSEYWLDLLAANAALLTELDIYERGLLVALFGSRTNNYARRDMALSLIRQANRGKLLAAGDPLPGPGPFTLYRGVAGRGPARQVRGLSWTGSLETARWFARRYPGLGDPAVFTAVVQANDVLSYTHARR